MLCGKRPRDACAADERRVTLSVTSSTSLPTNRLFKSGEDDSTPGQASRPSQLLVVFRFVCSHLYGAHQFVCRAHKPYTTYSPRELLHLHLHRGPSLHPLSGLALETTRVTPPHRLSAMGCGFTAMLSVSMSCSSAAPTSKASPRSAHAIYLRVAAVRAAALLERAFQECQQLRAACDFASAAAGYNLPPQAQTLFAY